MGRKKKTEEKVLIPSKYQENILEFINHGVGNLVVEASAGCGKTSTLVMAIKSIDPDKSILFCAFNRDIVKDIKKKTKEFENVDVTTVHGLGLRMLRANLTKEKMIPNENKYTAAFLNNTRAFTSLNTYSLGKKNYSKYMRNISSLLNLIRLNLYQTEEEAEELVLMHGIDIIADEIEVAFKLMEWGKEHLDEVDYTDMVWLPHVLYLKPYGVQYDFVFGDEAQDFSTAQRELLLKCKKINTRFVFVGDENQAIYAFASADKDSFNKLRNLPNTTTLPLPISYRCAKNIVKFAQTYVPRIEANDADDRIGEIKYNVSLDDVSDGDMVLCRNNAPLMQLYDYFIKKEKPCFIKGKDIGKNLKTLVKDTKLEPLNRDLKHDGVFVQLYKNLFDLKDYLVSVQHINEESAINSQIFGNLLDKIRALEVLSIGLTTATELIDKISNIFSDKQKEGITLSTIHKAKGLEADNVYIACPSLLPSKSATQKWEKEQENNLIYVAYTRAKNLLGFLDESNFASLVSNGFDTLKLIEKKVNAVLNRTSQEFETVDRNEKYTFASKPIIIPRKGNVKVLSEKNKQENKPTLGMMASRKLIKVKH